MPEEQQDTMIAVDSLVANEFAVELDGETLTGVFRVSGLTTFKLTSHGSETTMERVREPFTLVKMVQRDGNNPFNKWLRETVTKTSGSRPRRDITVMAVDDGVETRRWAFRGAWISEVRYSDFDSSTTEMVEEIITIHYDSLTESWPATSDLD